MSDSFVPPVRALASSVPSPCINVCRMNPANGYCVGCWRTIDEIVQWAALSDADKRVVWSAIERRRSGQ